MDLRRRFEAKFEGKSYDLEDLWKWVVKEIGDESAKMYDLGKSIGFEKAIKCMLKVIDDLKKHENN